MRWPLTSLWLAGYERGVGALVDGLRLRIVPWRFDVEAQAGGEDRFGWRKS